MLASKEYTMVLAIPASPSEPVAAKALGSPAALFLD
jgi:hypothetical protein